MINIAHRGAKLQATENSLLAFEKAIEHNVDMIELDVQTTRDGALIVIHDPTVDRTTNGTGLVSQMSLDEVQTLRTKEGGNIPTIEDVFELCRKRIQILVEIKSLGCLKRIAELIQQFDNEDEVILDSFLHLELVKYRQYDIRTRIAATFDEILLGGETIRDYLRSMQSQGAVIKHTRVTHELVEKMHEAGQFIFAWGLESTDDYREMEKLCVDGAFIKI